MLLLFFSLIISPLLVARPVELTVDVHHPTVIHNAAASLGGAIDGQEKGSSQQMLSPKSVTRMMQAGLKPLAYRLRTELGVEAWHWNPIGRWSDAKNHQGYWSSSTTARAPIMQSYGYRLPRRGATFDEANNDGYSRLDDGDPSSFWKSNPYLTSHYTGEPDSDHPQWAIFDFGKPVSINAARLHWGEPYATRFRLQYATGGDLYFGHNQAWHDFPHGKIDHGCGGAPLLLLGRPRLVRYVRILMSSSSGTALPGSSDPRDRMGYMLREVECGFLKNGILQDAVIHRPDQQQTAVTVSSTDPWHRASDLDERTEQPGVDAVAKSGLSHGEPILWSLPILYDTPENAARLVDYLQLRRYLRPHQRIELGEEPDGQHVDPKDVGELYAQVTHKIASYRLTIGGPSFVTIDCQPRDTTYRCDHRPWLRRFLQQLRQHHQEENFQFLTFEWYPFDDLLLPAPALLLQQTGMLRRAISMIRHGGVPADMPLLITEYGYSVFSGEPEVKLEAALLNAEIVCDFLLLGGMAAYLYGYEPNSLESGINNSWGNLMMLLEHDDGLIPLPTFYGAQMVSGLVKQGATIFPVKSSQPELAAYAFWQQNSDRPALLVINKNREHGYKISCRWGHGKYPMAGVYEKISYSPSCYRWHPDGPNGSPSQNRPPDRERLLLQTNTLIEVAPWSLTIIAKK
jgi:hypothetical protein